MTQYYLEEDRADDPHYLPSIETFYVEEGDLDFCDEEGCCLPAGFYWQSCMPGCLPDGEPSGPFETEQEALADARDGME